MPPSEGWRGGGIKTLLGCGRRAGCGEQCIVYAKWCRVLAACSIIDSSNSLWWCSCFIRWICCNIFLSNDVTDIERPNIRDFGSTGSVLYSTTVTLTIFWTFANVYCRQCDWLLIYLRFRNTLTYWHVRLRREFEIAMNEYRILREQLM